MFNKINKSNISSPANDEENQSFWSRHPILKVVGIVLVLLFAALYTCSEAGLSTIEKQTKEVLIDTNTALTGVNVSAEKVNTSLYGDGNDIYNLQVNNPPGFSSPFAINAANIRVNTVFSADKKYPYFIITSIVIKKSEINYEINGKNQTNLYKILDNVIARLSPPAETGFSPLDVLKPGVQKIPLNYTGAKFFIREIILEKPIVNVYKNNNLVKKMPLNNNITLSFINIEQPLQYGNALLGGCLQLIEQLDKAVK